MNKLYCIACPNGCLLTLVGTGPGLIVEGNKCDKGVDFAKAELADPTRTLTTTVRTNFPDVPVISVRTAGEIPKSSIEDAIDEINEIVVEQELGVGDVLIEDVADTGVSVIITSPALMKLGAELENKNAEVNRTNSASPAASGGAGVVATADTGGAAIMDMAAEGVLDDIGGNAADGFVGAAGQAVGVETDGTEGSDGKNGKGGKDSKERPAGRARVKIN